MVSGMRKRLKIFRVLIISVSLILVLMLAGLFIFSMEEQVAATGEIVGIKDYDLRNMTAGKIKEMKVEEGDPVRKGDIVLSLDDRKIQDEIQLEKNQVRELEAELEVMNASMNILKDDPLPTHYRHAKIELDEARKKYHKSAEKLAIYKKLYERTVISRKDFDKVEVDYINDKSDYEKAKEDYAKVSRGMGGKYITKAEQEMKLLQVKIENKKKRLEILEHSLEDYLVRAPQDGIVTSLPYEIGDYVLKGTIVAQAAKVSSKKLMSYVDERQIRKVCVGQKVRISSSSYNPYKFGYFEGEVVKVRELPVEKLGKSMFPVEVMITKEPYELKLGSTAEAEIITGRQKIIEGLLLIN